MIKLRRLRRRRESNTDSAWEELPVTILGQDVKDEPRLMGWREKPKKKDFNVKFQSLTIILLIILILLSLLFVKYMDSNLPQPLTLANRDSETMLFIEQRARKDLTDLTSVGVRVSGSEKTDVMTVEKLMGILREIKKSSNGQLNLEFEPQRPSGVFFMDDDEGHTSIYQKIANVVAKLEPKDPNLRTNNSVLFNCHFDSKPNSVGATDNMISCATMLEIIRAFVEYGKVGEILKNSLVFLFNGAEELGLQGAHGFVKGDGEGHRWAGDLKAFVNLEGAGSGGREILFQTGPGDGWILKAYASVPHPYGLVMGEEAFQLGLIPSDTDFRIFRDFRHIPGLDMAFIKNGWLYHTRMDRVTEIPPGSIQHMGDNTLALAKYFAKLDFTSTEKSNNKMVFFDVFGLFMVGYSETVGIVINIIISIIFIFITVIEVGPTPQLSHIRIYLWYFGSTLLAWGGGIAISVFVGAFFNWTNYLKPFFSYPSLTFLIFGVPSVLTSALVFSFAWKEKCQRQSWFAQKLTTAILLFCLSFVTRVVYILTLILVFAILAWLLRRFVFKRWKLARVELITILLIGEWIPFLFNSYMIITLADVFVPIMGRTGTETNPNIFLGMIIGAMITILAFNGLVTYLVNARKINLIVALLVSIFVVNPLIIVGFIGRVPFQEKTPMRIRILDTDRTWYNPTDGLNGWIVNRSDAGYWVWPVDPNTIDFLPEFSKTMPGMKDFIEIDSNVDTCSDLYCNQFFMWPTSSEIKKTPWIPLNQSIPSTIKDFVHLTVLGNTPVDSIKRNLSLSFSGPAQMSIVLSPGHNYNLIDWDLGIHVAKSGSIKYEGRPTYFIYVGNGYQVSTMNVSLVFQQKWEQLKLNEQLVDIMYVGHFIDNVSVEGTNFQEFKSQFPTWAHVMSWTGVLKQYTIL